MRILMVTPYPPLRDGIAAYAVQTVAALRAEGHDVDVLSPSPSAAHFHLALAGPRGALALAKRVRRYDRLIIQFHPDFFYPLPPSPGQWTATSAALRVAFSLAHEVEVRIHEIDYRIGSRRSLNGLAARMLWRSVDRIVVHTERERADFIKAFGVRPDRVEVVHHGAEFRRNTDLDRVEARRSLGIAEDANVFLSIGFIQPHKGFDRAVRAFSGLDAAGWQLAIVGSVRVEDPGYLDYLEDLRALVAATPGASLHEGYVSDELFDRWIVASDAVVLPYRSIWSSGVLERARLYDRKVIATAVGGLPEQAGALDNVTLVADEQELRVAMAEVAGVRLGVHTEPWPQASEAGPELRERVQAMVRQRAAEVRGAVQTEDVPGVVMPVRRSGAASSDAVAPLRRLRPAVRPDPRVGSPARIFLKRVVRKLTDWEIAPVATQVQALKIATEQAIEELDRRIDETRPR